MGEDEVDNFELIPVELTVAGGKKKPLLFYDTELVKSTAAIFLTIRKL